MTLGHYFSCLNDMCTSHQATVLFHIHVMHVMDLMYIHNVSDTVRLDRNITPQITHLYSLFLSLSVYLYVPYSLANTNIDLLLVPILHQRISYLSVKFIKLCGNIFFH